MSAPVWRRRREQKRWAAAYNAWHKADWPWINKQKHPANTDRNPYRHLHPDDTHFVRHGWFVLNIRTGGYNDCPLCRGSS